MDNIDLSTIVKTKSQADDLAVNLAAIMQQVYQTNFDPDKVLLDKLGIEVKDKFITLLRDSRIDYKKSADLEKFLEKIAAQLKTMPVLDITLAFEPKEKSLEVLDNWFSLNLKQQYLFEIKIDHSLIAGASIDYKGRHSEFSIKDKVTALLEAQVQAQQPANG